MWPNNYIFLTSETSQPLLPDVRLGKNFMIPPSPLMCWRNLWKAPNIFFVNIFCLHYLFILFVYIFCLYSASHQPREIFDFGIWIKSSWWKTSLFGNQGATNHSHHSFFADWSFSPDGPNVDQNSHACPFRIVPIHGRGLFEWPPDVW